MDVEMLRRRFQSFSLEPTLREDMARLPLGIDAKIRKYVKTRGLEVKMPFGFLEGTPNPFDSSARASTRVYGL